MLKGVQSKVTVSYGTQSNKLSFLNTLYLVIIFLKAESF